MKKQIIAILLICSTIFLFADDALIKSVKGKVEYSSDGQTWFPAEPNQVLKKGDFISTSFKSTAVIVVNGSIINVKALTRMSLDELTTTASGPQTELYLVSGKVQVEVKPSAKQEVTTFKVKSAMATASVRGTGFEFDGENLLVNHGSVLLMNNFGVSRSFNGGDFGNSGKRGKMLPPVAVKKPAAALLNADSTDNDVDNAAQQMGNSPLSGSNELLTFAAAFAPDAGSSPKPDDLSTSNGASNVDTAIVLITVQ